MALQKLVRELYVADSFNLIAHEGSGGPARTLTTVLPEYGKFVKVSEEKEPKPEPGEQPLPPGELEIDLRVRWEGDVACIPGCRIRLTQCYTKVNKSPQFCSASLEYLPPQTREIEESLSQLRDILAVTGLRRISTH